MLHDLYALQDWFTFSVTHVVEPLADFGVSGLLAILWLKERRVSQKREDQLNQSHDRLLHDRVELQTLITVVRSNTKTLENFARSHTRLIRSLTRTRNRPRKPQRHNTRVSSNTPRPIETPSSTSSAA